MVRVPSVDTVEPLAARSLIQLEESGEMKFGKMDRLDPVSTRKRKMLGVAQCVLVECDAKSGADTSIKKIVCAALLPEAPSTSAARSDGATCFLVR